MKKTNPIIRTVRIVFAVTSVVALALGIISMLAERSPSESYFVTATTALVSLAITFVPSFVADRDMIVLPVGLQAMLCVFTFFAMFLGEILDFYERFEWWDTMLHFASGVIFSMIGYMLFLSFNRDASVRRQLNPAIVVLFTVCFSVTCGAIWEIFEFAGDSLLGMNMQRWQSGLAAAQWSALQNASNVSNPGLVNTMKDIISDTLGSALSAFIILPLARHNSRYAKTPVPQSVLLAECNMAVAELHASKRTARGAKAA